MLLFHGMYPLFIKHVLYCSFNSCIYLYFISFLYSTTCQPQAVDLDKWVCLLILSCHMKICEKVCQIPCYNFIVATFHNLISVITDLLSLRTSTDSCHWFNTLSTLTVLTHVFYSSYCPKLGVCRLALHYDNLLSSFVLLIDSASTSFSQSSQGGGHRTLLYGHAILLKHTHSNMVSTFAVKMWLLLLYLEVAVLFTVYYSLNCLEYVISQR